MTNSSDKYADYACKMRKTNGDPCQSPALKGEDFCHYYKVKGPSPVEFDNQTFRSTHVYLPRLESASSIQAAISEVCELMLHCRIEPKEASALFYAMQVASQNLEPQALPPGPFRPLPRRRPGRPRKTAPQPLRAAN
jgi:hypothetical protein